MNNLDLSETELSKIAEIKNRYEDRENFERQKEARENKIATEQIKINIEEESKRITFDKVKTFLVLLANLGISAMVFLGILYILAELLKNYLRNQ